MLLAAIDGLVTIGIPITTAALAVVVAIWNGGKTSARLESRIEKAEDRAKAAEDKAVVAATEAKIAAERTASNDLAIAGIVPRLANLETTCAETRDDVKSLLRSRP